MKRGILKQHLLENTIEKKPRFVIDCDFYINLSLVLCLPTGSSWHPASPGRSVVSPFFHFDIPILTQRSAFQSFIFLLSSFLNRPQGDSI